MLYILLSMIFFTVVLVTLGISNYIFNKNPLNRLNKYFQEGSKDKKENTNKKQKTHFLAAFRVLGETLMGVFALNRFKERMDENLKKADIPLKAEEMLFIVFMLSIVIFTLTLAITRSVVGSLMLVIIVILIPMIVIKNKVQKRLNEINQQLGDALDMMSGSLRAGYSFIQAIEAASKEMPPPISREFSQVMKELNLGLSVEDALGNLLSRVTSDDLELLVSAVVIQRQIGGNLAEILDNISGTIRERIRLKGEVKTLTAQGRMSGWVISLLPIGLGAMIFIINPEYMKVLFTDKIGLVMIIMALFNQVIGIFIIKKVIDIKY